MQDLVEQHTQFIELLTALPAEGETLLLTQQVALQENGAPLTYSDGSIRYLWPASLPHRRTKKSGAWYGNTGSFILSRFNGGKPSASAANCDYVLVMVLDDIGTKSKAPPLAPTWKMETSPDNFQWGYVFDPDNAPRKGEFCAAIKAIAKAGFTDGGAINAVRNFRLPKSINLKPGRDNFASRLVEFHPDRQFTLPQIIQALQVIPDEADTAAFLPIRLTSDSADPMLMWLSNNGFLLEPVNAAGWAGVVCPNYQEHSDGNVTGRYNPVSHAYLCYHEHCTHLDSKSFLAAVEAEGAPHIDIGVSSELTGKMMTSALNKINGVPDNFQDTVFHPVEETLRDIVLQQLGREEVSDWHKHFLYVQNEDGYFDVRSRQLVPRRSFNAIFRGVECRSMHGGRRIEASIRYDELRVINNAQVLSGVTYAAGDDVIVGKVGSNVLKGNCWVDARPDLAQYPDGDASPWLDLMRTVVPNPTEREHILDLMAFKLQHPEIKINHAVLHIGTEGCGKDSMWAPFIWAVCGDFLANRGYLDNDTINSGWGYALECEILIINELKEPSDKERRALANKLKPIIAAPPETLPISRKFQHPYDMVNRLMVIAFSNEQIPISIPDEDRRWFVTKSPAPRMETAAANILWSWYKKGGFAQCGKFLMARDVTKFNPGATPPTTDAKIMLVENGRSVAESYIVEKIRDRKDIFSKGVIIAPFHTICDTLALQMPSGTKVPKAALLHALKEARWVDLGMTNCKEYPTKKHGFASPDMAAAYSKSDLRRMAESVKTVTIEYVANKLKEF